MAKDDMFRLIYAILKELYENMKDGKLTPRENIVPERYGINESYWLDIMDAMLSRGYIAGLTIRATKCGRVVTGLDDITITIDGVEYLENNSMMRKVAEALKEVKDIVPMI